MHPKVLEDLSSDDFFRKAGVIGTPKALYALLGRQEEVDRIRRSLESGAITENQIRLFVEDRLKHLKEGEHFPHELELCALAVALERRGTEFADEFINELAGLELAEMRRCIEVAKLCQDFRKTSHTLTFSDSTAK